MEGRTPICPAVIVNRRLEYVDRFTRIEAKNFIQLSQSDSVRYASNKPISKPARE